MTTSELLERLQRINFEIDTMPIRLRIGRITREDAVKRCEELRAELAQLRTVEQQLSVAASG